MKKVGLLTIGVQQYLLNTSFHKGTMNSKMNGTPNGFTRPFQNYTRFQP